MQMSKKLMLNGRNSTVVNSYDIIKSEAYYKQVFFSIKLTKLKFYKRFYSVRTLEKLFFQLVQGSVFLLFYPFRMYIVSTLI